MIKGSLGLLPLCFKTTASFPSVGYGLMPVFIMLLSCSEISSGHPHPCLLRKGLTPCLGVQGPLRHIPIHRSNVIFHRSVCKFSNPARVSQYFSKGPRHLCSWPCLPPFLSVFPFLLFSFPDMNRRGDSWAFGHR